MRLKKSLTGKLTKINSPVEDQKSGKYSECPWLWGPCSKTNLPAIEIGHYLRRFKSLHKAAKDDMSCQSTWYECEWAWKMRGSLRKPRRSRSLNCSWKPPPAHREHLSYHQLQVIGRLADAMYKALQRVYPDEKGGERNQESEYGKKGVFLRNFQDWLKGTSIF